MKYPQIHQLKVYVSKDKKKNVFFADDATFMTDGTETSFTTLVDVLDNFSHISGLKLNSSKCSFF